VMKVGTWKEWYRCKVFLKKNQSVIAEDENKSRSL
jgi:hypothetical protein